MDLYVTCLVYCSLCSYSNMMCHEIQWPQLSFGIEPASLASFVHADWKDPETGTVYHFKSDAGGMDLLINHPLGSSIDVLIDPRNPQQYEVQLRFEERSFV